MVWRNVLRREARGTRGDCQLPLKMLLTYQTFNEKIISRDIHDIIKQNNIPKVLMAPDNSKLFFIMTLKPLLDVNKYT